MCPEDVWVSPCCAGCCARPGASQTPPVLLLVPSGAALTHVSAATLDLKLHKGRIHPCFELEHSSPEGP